MTQPTDASVDSFLASVENARRRADALVVKDVMERISGHKPVMWGKSQVGFGRYHYRYKSGHTGSYFLTGFAPGKANLVLYILPGYGEDDDLMARLGKFRRGRACIYVNRLSDIDMDVLERLIARSLAKMRELYPGPGDSSGKPGA